MDYLPAESNTGMFGGNSNWRGPVWMPVNAMIIRALLQFYLYYGDNFKIECPTGSGKMMNLFEVSKEISDRLTRIFLRDEHGRRPVYGGTEKFQSDPHWRDHILFYEYFHGDNGAGLAPAIRPAGPGWWPSSSSSMALWMRSGPWKAARWRLSRKQRGKTLTCSEPTLSLALSDQHPRLADGTVPSPGPAGHAGRHSGRRTGSPGRTGFRLDLVPERLADRAWRRSKSRAAIPSGARNSRRRCRTCARKTSPAPASRSPATRCIRISAATLRWPACASGSASAA